MTRKLQPTSRSEITRSMTRLGISSAAPAGTEVWVKKTRPGIWLVACFTGTSVKPAVYSEMLINPYGEFSWITGWVNLQIQNAR